MTLTECAPITVTRRGSTQERGDAEGTVVWLRGEHDLATRASLVSAIARAARPADGVLLVDLSQIAFMDASTIGVLVGLNNRLHRRSQSLLLRAPSPPARRLLELCDLAHLVQPSDTNSGPMSRRVTPEVDRGGP
jgi:anti-anti-sigma factor